MTRQDSRPADDRDPRVAAPGADASSPAAPGTPSAPVAPGEPGEPGVQGDALGGAMAGATWLDEVEAIARIGSYMYDIAADRWTSSAGLDALLGIDSTYRRSVEGWTSLVHPDERDAMLAYFANDVLGRGQPFDREYRIVRANTGEVRTVHGRGALEFDDSGHPVRMLGTIADITERVVAESERAALIAAERASHAQLRALLDHAPDAIMIGDGAGVLIDINPAGCALMGGEPSDFVGQHLTAMLPPGELERQPLGFDRLVVGRAIRIDRRFLRRDGTVVPVELHVSRLPDGRIQALVRDMTARVAAETALYESRAYLARAQELAELGTWELDVATGTMTTSQNIEAMAGVSLDSDPLLPVLLATVHPDDAPVVVAELERAATNDDPMETEFRVRHAGDGTEHHIRIRAKRDRPGHLVGTALDVTSRFRAAQALREQTQELLRAQRIARLASWSLDAATGQVTMSGSALALIGLEPDDGPTAGLDLLESVVPEDRADLREAIRVAGRAREGLRSEFRVLAVDGTTRYVELQAEPRHDADGTFLGLGGTVQDISERARAAEDLRRSERNLAAAQAIAHIGSWEWDIGTNRTLRSAETQRILGVEPGRMPDTIDAFYAFVHPDDRERVRASERSWIALSGRNALDFRVVRPDGSIRMVREESEVIRDSLGAPVSMVGTLQDITEQRRLEVERDRLLAAIEQSSDSVMVLDGDRRIAYANQAFGAMTGYPREELYGVTPAILAGTDGGTRATDGWQAFAAGQPWTGTLVAVGKDGLPFEAEWALAPILDATGGPTGHVAIARDRSRERSLEAQVARIQRIDAVGQLAAGIAHDFNNLLTAARGYAQLLRDPLPESDPTGADLDQIIAATDRGATLVRQLLAFARRQTIERVVLDLNGIIEGIVPMLRRLIGENIELDVRPGPRIGHIRSDRSQVEQLILNLATNARDAMPHGGRLVIATAGVVLTASGAREHAGLAPGPYVLLEVSDTGRGMDAATLGHLFEPFFTTKEPDRGTGLGLATVYGIVAQAGGHVAVASTVGRGTTFTIYLPQVADRVSASAEEGPGPTVAGTETILVVEDEDSVRRFTVRALEACGYKVISAASPADALALPEAETAGMGLLVSDVTMPGLSGPELAALLKRRLSGLRVLYISGYAGRVAFDEGADPGTVAFLAKPFSTAEIALRVRELLDAPRT